MGNDSVTTRYRQGEVVIGEKIHGDTSIRVDKDEAGTNLYEVEGKSRPMLVIGTPLSHVRVYETLDFTKQRPANGHPDFYLQANNNPRCCGHSLGSTKPSFLRLFPLNPCSEKKMKPGHGLKPFPKELMIDILKAVNLRLLKMPQTEA